MSGLPNFNFPAFSAAARLLRERGHIVVSPHELDMKHDEFDPASSKAKPFKHYMRRDLPQVMRADAVATLPNWRGSKGARLEAHVATECDIPILRASTLEPDRETVLEEAGRLTSQDRNRTYGHPRDDFECIATMWQAYLRKKQKKEKPGAPIEIGPRDVAMMMALVKVARDATAPIRDNLADMAGYARCAERLEEPAA